MAPPPSAEHDGQYQKFPTRPDRDQQQGEFDELLGIEAGDMSVEHPAFSTATGICMAARDT
jgi:hypothetical protein